jgi:hypothetical protein
MLPLSTYYAQESETWLRQNPGKVVTARQVDYLFGKAYRRAATPRNVENGFQNTGICPFDPNFLLKKNLLLRTQEIDHRSQTAIELVLVD